MSVRNRSKGQGYLITFCVLVCNVVSAQVDSVNFLREVEVKSTLMPAVSHHATPSQTLNSTSLARLQALQISDAVKHFAGVTVKDYGGVGGLKTVSVRGLGANHTAFAYDGITITDSQNGQADLGKFSLNNVDEVSLAIGGPDTLLSTARAFASGSLLSVRTAAPVFQHGRKMSAGVNVKVGSFGLINPAVVLKNRLNKKLSSSFAGEVQRAGGEYPYTLDYGGITSRERRHNTDVMVYRAEENIFATFSNKARLVSKIYYYHSERGLPGATIYYNPHSSQRLWDRNFFVQSRYEKSIGRKVETLFNAKYTSTYLRYLDPDYLGTAGKLENEYNQKEAYVSGAAVVKASENISVGLSTDGSYGTMDANLYQFPYPSRYTWLTAVHGKLHRQKLDVQLGAVSTVVGESVQEGSPAAGHKRLSPSVTLGYRPMGNETLLLRIFYKDIFRMPTFNDLYCTGVGNNKLRPENARQLNAGIACTRFFEGMNTYLSGSLDVYHNRVTDKIVAIPTKNLFIWTMMNIGVVNINGADVVLKGGYTPVPSLSFSLETSYTYQQAQDKTNPESKTYGDQIAYTPVHSGALTASITNDIVDVSYNLLFAGSRYTLNHNIPPNSMQGYAEHGMTLRKKIVLQNVTIAAGLEVLNILDTQYEVVRNFPMPGRSYRLTTSFTF